MRFLKSYQTWIIPNQSPILKAIAIALKVIQIVYCRCSHNNNQIVTGFSPTYRKEVALGPHFKQCNTYLKMPLPPPKFGDLSFLGCD